MLRAGITGKPTATPVLPLLTGGAGINVYRPVYRDRAPAATVAERRAALIGFAGGAFQVNDLAAAAAAAVPSTVDVQLREGGKPVAGPEGELDDPAAAPIHVADRAWLLAIHDPSRPDVGLPLLIAVFGVALAALLGALVMIWSRNERMQELQRLADHDSLTGLKNRRRFEEDLRTEMARADREGLPVALLLLDLDNLKDVNDSLGHGGGDRMIVEVAEVLGSRMRETDVLARIGGDEFAIVLPRCEATEATIVGEAIATAIREHSWDGGEQRATVSIGIAVFPSKSGTTLDELLLQADNALYAAKGEGRDGVRAFSPTVRPGS
jgi:diguanylate cyclase (GGDEF)-like protein